jgi:hypothetical protein
VQPHHGRWPQPVYPGGPKAVSEALKTALAVGIGLLAGGLIGLAIIIWLDQHLK